MNNRIRALAIFVVAASYCRAALSDPANPLPNFFIAPIKTEVHRALVSDQASAYAVVNCSALIDNAKVNLAPLNEPQFENELKKLVATEPSHLKLALRYRLGAEGTEATRESIKSRLKEIAHSAGFQTVSVSEFFTSAEWKDEFEPIRTFKEIEADREQIVEDELIKAYPLRTKLSKMVLGDADVVVEIMRPFDGRQKHIPNTLRASIKRAVERMDLKQKKGKLLFELSTTSAGEEVIQKLFDSRQPVAIPPGVTNPAILKALADEAAKYRPSQGLELAIELGFDRISYRHTPGGGAPEKLIGQPAPDFALTTLDDKELKLRKFIDGRPALVTFWGVACGPCCLEAPHLTTMHQKYGPQFAIVAVNGYDESRDVVSAFAEQARLKHPIALNGRAVADDAYHVGAYPTTFWIKRDGTVEDYDVDMHSAASLERRIQKMLADR